MKNNGNPYINNHLSVYRAALERQRRGMSIAEGGSQGRNHRNLSPLSREESQGEGSLDGLYEILSQPSSK